MAAKRSYDDQVFINCPFDGEYQPLFEALVFAVHDCGFVARCALEAEDGSQVRIEKIEGDHRRVPIWNPRHLAYRARWDVGTAPLQHAPGTGAVSGSEAVWHGEAAHEAVPDPGSGEISVSKVLLGHRAGQDIRSHDGDPFEAVRIMRNWLRNAMLSSQPVLPSGSVMVNRYRLFQQEIDEMCDRLRFDRQDLIFNDFVTLAAAWLKVNPW